MRLYDTNGWISISQTSCVDRAVTQWELIMFFFFFVELWSNETLGEQRSMYTTWIQGKKDYLEMGR